MARGKGQKFVSGAPEFKCRGGPLFLCGYFLYPFRFRCLFKLGHSTLGQPDKRLAMQEVMESKTEVT